MTTRKTPPPTWLLIKRLMQTAGGNTEARPSLENNAEALFLVIVPMQAKLVRGEVNWIDASRSVVWSHPPACVHDNESLCFGGY